MYGKEQTEQEAKIAAMREDDSKDEYDVRKQEEVLAETVAMIPDTRGRLERGHEDLEELLVRRRPAPLRHGGTTLRYVHSLPRYTQPPLPPSQAEEDVVALGDAEEVVAARDMLKLSAAVLGLDGAEPEPEAAA